MNEFKELSPNRIVVISNYRKTFNQKSLKELAKSIEKNGIIEPLIVRGRVETPVISQAVEQVMLESFEMVKNA